MHDLEGGTLCPHRGTYFGILNGLHNIIVIITLNVYIIFNQREKTTPLIINDISKTTLQAYFKA